jgi:hypothetical protein
VELERLTIEVGSSLWRHHNETFPANRLRAAHPHPTGRFDCPNPGGWASSYFALTTQGAFGETLLRDIATGTATMVPTSRLSNTAVSRVVATRDLALIDLRGAGMWPALNNDIRLLGYPVDDTIYSDARDAADRLHDEHPDVDGLAWRSVRNPNATSVLLWDDTTEAPLTTGAITPLGTDHHQAVAALLLAWHAVLMHHDHRVEPDLVAVGVLGWTH